MEKMGKKKKKKTIKKKTKTAKTSKDIKKISLWYLPFLVLFILFVSFSSLLFFLFSNNYKDWQEGFESSSIEMLDFKDNQIELDGKIQEYNEAESEYAFIEFDKRESLFLLSMSLDESLPDWVEIEKTALETSRGNWRFFVKSQVLNFSFPWLQISLSKEEVQSVDVYIDDIFLGDLSFKNIYLDFVVENANRGLARAIQLVNDGNFAERVFENIELAEDSLIIRSRNITYF